MQTHTRYDLALAVAILLISVLYLAESIRLIQDGRADLAGVIVPVIAGCGMGVAALVLGVQELSRVAGRREATRVGTVQRPDGHGEPSGGDGRRNQQKASSLVFGVRSNWRVIVTGVMILTYGVLLEPLGFLVSTLVYVVLQTIVLKVQPTRRDVVTAVVMGVVAAVGLRYLFGEVFYVLLP